MHRTAVTDASQSQRQTGAECVCVEGGGGGGVEGGTRVYLQYWCNASLT